MTSSQHWNEPARIAYALAVRSAGGNYLRSWPHELSANALVEADGGGVILLVYKGESENESGNVGWQA